MPVFHVNDCHARCDQCSVFTFRKNPKNRLPEFGTPSILHAPNNPGNKLNMTPIKSNLAPLTKRISALAITAAAAFSFSLFSPSAEAAPLRPTKEYLAVQAELPTGVTVETATPAQLAQAVTD